MQKVRCYECGKQYDYDVDDFCPRCGAFNQPPRSTRIGADGSVIRAEGLNERNHQNSFVHAEFHEENKARRGTPLSKGIKRTVRPAPGRAAAGSGAARTSGSQEKRKNPFAPIFWFILVLIIFRVFANSLFWLF